MIGDLFTGMFLLYFAIAMPFVIITLAYMPDDGDECSMTEWGEL